MHKFACRACPFCSKVIIAHFAQVGVPNPNRRTLHKAEHDKNVVVLPWARVNSVQQLPALRRKGNCRTPILKIACDMPPLGKQPLFLGPLISFAQSLTISWEQQALQVAAIVGHT